MDPFIKKVRTQAEKDALIAEARRAWDQAGEFTHLLGGDEESYLAKISDSIIVEGEPFIPARALTSAEKDQQNADLLLMQMRYNAHPYENLPPVLRTVAEAQDAAGLAKLLGPALRERNTLAGMIESAIAKAVRTALAKGSSSPSINRETIPVRSQPVREGIHPAMSAIAHDDSDIGRFVKAWIDGDTATQREIASELAAA